MRVRQLVASLVTAVIIARCASPSTLPCSPGEQTVVLDTLYFGTAKPGGLVTAEEWTAVLEETVVQDFREGLTFWTVAGRWANAAGVVLGEASYLLQLAHDGSPGKDRALQRIVQRYKRKFQQEAVMRIRSQACRSF